MSNELRVVAGIIVREGRVLLTQRTPGRDHSLRWECPGGKIEAGESPREALARELAEEIGWEWGEIAPWPFYETSFAAGEAGRLPISLAFFRVTPPVGWRPSLADVEGAGWFSLAEMQSLPLVPGNVRLFERLLQSGLG